jgi:hypothetical protein
MAFDADDKEKLVESLTEARRSGQKLEVTLRLQGKPDDADKVQKKNKALSDQIDVLIGKLMDDWVATADPLVSRVRKGSAQVQAAINDIKQKVDVAQNVVKALGALDDAIAVAKTALAAAAI